MLSFYKHFNEGLKYCEGLDISYVLTNVQDISIEDSRYKKYQKAYDYALAMTKKECMQGVEGFSMIAFWFAMMFSSLKASSPSSIAMLSQGISLNKNS